jgi:hypothetical protein
MKNMFSVTCGDPIKKYAKTALPADGVFSFLMFNIVVPVLESNPSEN